MGHIPEEENFDEFMDASAESWSEPEEPAPEPEEEPEPTNRWGSPLPDPTVSVEEPHTESKPVSTILPGQEIPAKKSGAKWWVIAIIIVVILCLCVCAVIVGLILFGVNIFDSTVYQNLPYIQ